MPSSLDDSRNAARLTRYNNMLRGPASRDDAKLSAGAFGTFLSRTLEDFWALAPAQRDAFVRRLLTSDPDLALVLDRMLALYRGAKNPRDFSPLRRDAVG
jgi:hypothetical protein